MGNKGAVDLPDPMNSAKGGGGGAPNADDLLSQLAGSEIDRLLAEADVERESAGAAEGPTGSGSTAGEIEQKFQSEKPWKAPAASEAAARPGVEAGAGSSAQEEVAAELDQLFAQLNSPKPKIVTPPAAPVVEAPAPVTEEQVAAVAAPAVEKGSAATDEELLAYVNGQDAGALAAPVDAQLDVDGDVAKLMASVTAGEDVETEQAEAEGRVSLLVRILMWMNAPFAGIGEGARTALGKVAIATLINSVAVLVYVLMFKGKK